MNRILTTLMILAMFAGVLFAETIFFKEDFENITTLPADWENYSWTTTGYEPEFVNGIGVFGSKAMKYHSFYDGEDYNDLELYGPYLDPLPANAVLKIDYRIMAAGSTTTAGTFGAGTEIYFFWGDDEDALEEIDIADIHMTSTAYKTVTIDLSDYDELEDSYFGFYIETSMNDNFDLHIDNIRIVVMDEDDLAAHIMGNTIISIDEPRTYTIIVENVGSESVDVTETTYTVTLMLVNSEGADTSIGSVTGTAINLAPDATATFTATWTPTELGIHEIYGKVTYASDDDQTNNESAILEVNVIAGPVLDLAVSLAGPAYIEAGEETDYTVTVSNVGEAAVGAGDYDVILMLYVDGTNDTVIDTVTGTALAVNATATFDIAWQPTDTGVYQIYAIVDYDEDVNLANNETDLMSVAVLPANLLVADIYLEDTWYEGDFPVNYLYENSLSQTIYTKEEMGGWANIGKVWMLNMRIDKESYNPVPNDIPVQIYLANAPATLTSFDDEEDYVDFTEFTKVYDGPLDLGGVTYDNDIVILLGTGPGTDDFVYEGENLVLMMYKDDNAWYSGYSWHVNDGTAGVNRTIYQYSDDDEIDVEDPLPIGDYTYSDVSIDFPMIKFYIEGIDYGTTLTVTVTDDDETPSPITTAKVYVADWPAIFVEENTDGVYEFENISMDWDIAVSATGYEPQTFTSTEIAWNTTTKTASLSVELEALIGGLKIAGYVKLPDTGLGQNGVTVYLDGYLTLETTTANDTETTPSPGYFEFTVYGNRSYTVSVDVLHTNNAYYEPPEPIEVTLTTTSRTDLEFMYEEVIGSPLAVSAAENAENSEHVVVTWFNPLSSIEYDTLCYWDADYYSTFGATYPMTAFHRYNQAMLTARGLAGAYLSEVTFLPVAPEDENENPIDLAGIDFKLVIYNVADTAELTANIATPLYEQIIPSSELQDLWTYTVVLQTPFLVPATNILYIGIWASAADAIGLLGSMNTYNAFASYGNVAWLFEAPAPNLEPGLYTIGAAANNFNWAIESTFIVPPSVTAPSPSMRVGNDMNISNMMRANKIQSTDALQIASNFTESEDQPALPSNDDSDLTRAFSHKYNVYRKLASETNFPATPLNSEPFVSSAFKVTYPDNSLTVSDAYVYAVTAIYEGDEYDDPIESDAWVSNVLPIVIWPVLSGSITRTNGTVAGFEVRIFDIYEDDEVPMEVVTTTDAGTFSFKVPAGWYRFEIQMPGTNADGVAYGIYDIDAEEYLVSTSLGAIDMTSLSGADDIETPKVTALRSNYPNPFNPTTTISFDMARDGHVSIDVYNIKGQKVNTLANRVYETGTHRVVWNGDDSTGRAVGSGVYFYRMTTDGYSKTQKMLLMK